MSTQLEAQAIAPAALDAGPDAIGVSAWLDDALVAEPWSAPAPLPFGACECRRPDPDAIGLCGSCGLEVGWRPNAHRG